MCSSKCKVQQGVDIRAGNIGQINGRPVLQPATCNRVPSSDHRRYSPKNISPKSPPTTTATTPKSKIKANSLIFTPPKLSTPVPALIKININALNSSDDDVPAASTSSMTRIVEAPGSIAAARREQVSMMQQQRKMRISHYGRAKSQGKLLPLHSSPTTAHPQEKRCTFITPNSDPIYVAYHDEEWGVPVHDDKLLFELLVLTGAQVGSDWTSVLKKRQDLRDAFCGFDAQVVSKFSEKKITSITADYGMNLSQVRGVVDNSNRILQIKREMGSLEKYIWGFVNEKAITTNYKSCHKIPAKTSKSESISKDMVKRGFRFVGPTVMYSFMQAAGLTNDHLITCPRHLQCSIAFPSHPPSTVAPAL